MAKNILVVSSVSKLIYALTDLFRELSSRGFAFYFVCTGSAGAAITENSFFRKRIFLGPDMGKNSGAPMFIALLPFLWLFFSFYLIYYRFSKKIEAIILCSWNEKIIFTLPAKLLKIKVIWLEPPEYAVRGYKKIGKLLFALFKLNSFWAKIIVFNVFAGAQLKEVGVGEDNIKVIQPGIRLNQRENQGDIFSELARADTRFRRKFFTVGAEIDLGKEQKIETLLQAVKICLPLIPHIQLVIIGAGGEKKNLAWLAKKMGLETVVWFVGQQENTRQWLENFDIFVVVSELPALADAIAVLKAMAAGLPVIGPKRKGLEDIIYENKTGVLIEADNSEMLARQIIKLYQDKRLRLKIGELARERVEQYFTLDKQIAEFEKIFD